MTSFAGKRVNGLVVPDLDGNDRTVEPGAVILLPAVDLNIVDAASVMYYIRQYLHLYAFFYLFKKSSIVHPYKLA